MDRILSGAGFIASIALLAGGCVLIMSGVHTLGSIASAFTRLLPGRSSDQAPWLLAAGAVVAAFGAGGLLRHSRPF